MKKYILIFTTCYIGILVLGAILKLDMGGQGTINTIAVAVSAWIAASIYMQNTRHLPSADEKSALVLGSWLASILFSFAITGIYYSVAGPEARASLAHTMQNLSPAIIAMTFILLAGLHLIAVYISYSACFWLWKKRI